jgi:selenocysteine-specific elongation factor
MIYATAGHVDHGKTSLVKALTDIDTDRLAEEKARGLTIDLGFAYCEVAGERYGFVDVPGHAKFISNMLAGVSTIDHALIVIAADDGPMPQTLEHIDILKLLGLQDATIIVTKVDRVSSDHLATTQRKIREVLANSPFGNAKVFLTSAETGEGIEALKQYLFGKTVRHPASTQGYFRLAVDRRFTIKGAGIIVTGSVFSGEIEVGAELWLMPQQKKVRLRGLHRQDQTANKARRGDRCALNITGDVEAAEIHRGNWLTTHPAMPTSQRVDVELTVLESETAAVRTGAPVHFHVGADHTLGRVFLLNQRLLTPGETALAQIKLDTVINTVYGDRFVIRDQSASRTLGGGRVIDPISVIRGRSKPERLTYLNHLTHMEQFDAAELLLKCPSGVDLERLLQNLNEPQGFDSFARDKEGKHHHSEHVSALKGAVLKLIQNGPASTPDIARALGQRQALLQLVLDDLLSEKKLSTSAGKYALPESEPELSKPAATLWQKVRPILQQDPLQPPVISELAKQMNLPPAALEKLLSECVKQGLVVRPVKNRFFVSEVLVQLRQQAQKVAEANGGEFTVIQFRDASGIGRNLCIELLEHLDNKGFTKRLGDKRIIQDIDR